MASAPASHSPLGLAVDVVLLGARTALRRALTQAAADDPARLRAEQILTQLDQLLAGPSAAAIDPDRQPPADPQPGGGRQTPSGPQTGCGPPSATGPQPPSGTRPPTVKAGPGRALPPRAPRTLPEPVRQALADFAADPQVARRLGARNQDHADAATAWRAFWLGCLRLEPSLAAHWRQVIRAALERIGESDAALEGSEPIEPIRIPAPPGGAHQVLLPAHPGLGTVGLVEVPGLESALAHQLRLIGAAGEAAVVVQRLLTLMDLDQELCHALEGLKVLGAHPLREPGTLPQYRREIGRRLQLVARQPPGSVDELLNLYLLDEAVCSVIHLPPAHPDSWWGRLAAESRTLLRARATRLTEAGTPVTVRPLELLPYSRLLHLTAGRDLALPADGDQIGHVFACLRTWLDVGGQVQLGRVAYGSEQA